jgi:hypothetical protein
MFSDPNLTRNYCDSLSFASPFEDAAIEQQVLTDDEPGGRGAQIGSIPLVVHYLQFRFLTSVKEEEVINRAIIILKGINRRCP